MSEEQIKLLYQIKPEEKLIQPSKFLVRNWTKKNQKESINHIHPFSHEGATGSGGHCVFKNALRSAKVQLPTITGMKADKGAMMIGTWDHEIIQKSLQEEYDEHKSFWDAKNVQYYSEVYCCVFLTPFSHEEIESKILGSRWKEFWLNLKQHGIWYIEPEDFEIDDYHQFEDYDLNDFLDHIVQDVQVDLEDLLKFFAITHPDSFDDIDIPVMISPLDVVYAEKESIMIIPIPFGTDQEIIWKLQPYLKPWKKIKMIADIKSASSGSFYASKEVPIYYLSQFEKYMRATHMKELLKLTIEKQSGKLEETIVPSSNDVWMAQIHETGKIHTLCERLRTLNVHSYDELLQVKNKLNLEGFTKEDFGFFQQNWDWMGCPLSIVEEIIAEGYRPHMDLKEPCIFAKDMIKNELQKFAIGTRWKRGSSHVSIFKIQGDLIYCKNKSGKEFTDTKFYAWKIYKEI